LLKLYESGNIHNKVTVQYLISNLLTPTDNPQKQLVEHYKSIVKYLTNTPKTVARQQQKQQKQQEEQKRKIEAVFDKLDKKNKKGTYLIDVIFYYRPIEEDKTQENETDEQQKAQKRGGKYFHGLRQSWIGQVKVETTTIKLFEDNLRKLVSPHTVLKHIKNIKIISEVKFNSIIEQIIFSEKTNNGDGYIEHYLPDAIYIKDMFKLDLDNVKPHDQVKTKKRNDSKQSIKYSYISTPLDLSKDTFAEAIKNNNYIKNECWINTLYDFYKDTLLSTNKKRNVITREIILNVLNRTEEDIKEGLSVEDGLPFSL